MLGAAKLKYNTVLQIRSIKKDNILQLVVDYQWAAKDCIILQTVQQNLVHSKRLQWTEPIIEIVHKKRLVFPGYFIRCGVMRCVC